MLVIMFLVSFISNIILIILALDLVTRKNKLLEEINSLNDLISEDLSQVFIIGSVLKKYNSGSLYLYLVQVKDIENGDLSWALSKEGEVGCKIKVDEIIINFGSDIDIALEHCNEFIKDLNKIDEYGVEIND